MVKQHLIAVLFLTVMSVPYALSMDDTSQLVQQKGLADSEKEMRLQAFKKVCNQYGIKLHPGTISNIKTGKLHLSNKLKNKNLGDDFWDSLTQLSWLTHLHLYDNELPALPDNIGQLSNLRELALDDNQLTTLPNSIGEISTLQKLYLNHNRLVTLPDSIGQLSNLQELFLSNNQITTLPEC